MNTTKIPILKKGTSNYVELLILMDMGIATLITDAENPQEIRTLDLWFS